MTTAAIKLTTENVISIILYVLSNTSQTFNHIYKKHTSGIFKTGDVYERGLVSLNSPQLIQYRILAQEIKN